MSDRPRACVYTSLIGRYETLNEQPLARLEAGLREERVVRGAEHLHEAPGLRPVERVGHGQHVALVHDGEPGVAAAPEQRHDAVAGREPLCVRAGRDHLAGAFQAGHVLGCVRRRRIAAGALVEVGAVDAAGADAHEQLALARHRIRAFLGLEPTVLDRSDQHRDGMLRA